MKHYIILFLKGIAIGIANVIPGVSGGTIALVTEIYERLINSGIIIHTFEIKANIKKMIQPNTNRANLIHNPHSEFGPSTANRFRNMQLNVKKRFLYCVAKSEFHTLGGCRTFESWLVSS